MSFQKLYYLNLSPSPSFIVMATHSLGFCTLCRIPSAYSCYYFCCNVILSHNFLLYWSRFLFISLCIYVCMYILRCCLAVLSTWLWIHNLLVSASWLSSISGVPLCQHSLYLLLFFLYFYSLHCFCSSFLATYSLCDNFRLLNYNIWYIYIQINSDTFGLKHTIHLFAFHGATYFMLLFFFLVFLCIIVILPLHNFLF
jgi:hypothetical protein